MGGGGLGVFGDAAEAAGLVAGIEAVVSEQARVPVDLAPDMSIRVAGRVHRRLLTLQYERKMAGESVSLSEIIEHLLQKADAE